MKLCQRITEACTRNRVFKVGLEADNDVFCLSLNNYYVLKLCDKWNLGIRGRYILKSIKLGKLYENYVIFGKELSHII